MAELHKCTILTALGKGLSRHRDQYSFIQVPKTLAAAVLILQVEVPAIEICAIRCLQRGDISHGHSIIMLENQPALSHVYFRIGSRLVLECFRIVNKVYQKFRVILF